MSSESRRSVTADELRMWLNDRRDRAVTVGLQLDRNPDRLLVLSASGELGHASDDFGLEWVSENAELAGGTYTVGPMVLAVADFDGFEMSVLTGPEYDGAEMIEIQLAPSITLTIADPF